MAAIFADTFYWISLLNPKDTWHLKIIEVSQEISNSQLVITDGVVDEIFAYYSKRGDFLRSKVSELYKNILKDPNIQVVSYRTHLISLDFNQLFS